MRNLFIALLLLFSFEKCLAFDCCKFGNLAVEAEWIYFQPAVDASILMRHNLSVAAFNEALRVQPHHHSGWRVGAEYLFCDGLDFLSLRWTQLKTLDRKTFSAPAYLSFNGQLIFTDGTNFDARDRFKFDYYCFEALFSHRCCHACRFDFDVLLGLQWARIATHEKIFFFLDVGDALSEQGAFFRGTGPEIGFDLAYCICGNFSLVGRATTALLVSRIRSQASTVSSNFEEALPVELKDGPYWKVVPTWNIRAGIRYNQQICCTHFCVEVGYEAIAYNRALEYSLPFFGGDFFTVNADMHGLYVQAGIIF